MPTPLLLCGASVRAAAWSAWRAGFTNLHAIDLFADADLALNCPVHPVSSADYPAGLANRASELPPGPILYTGALENYPRLVNQLGKDRPLWGNSPQTLVAVRDPALVAHTLKDVSLPHPRFYPHTSSSNIVWLAKRIRGAAGFGVYPWQGDPLDPDEYLQEFIPGPPHAAIFCGYPDNQSLLLGVTRQLVGEDWTHAKPFHYCGSVGPVDIGNAGTNMLERLGSVLVQRFGLRGLFGVDFILHDDHPYPVEINPRYTASVEILERATTLLSLTHHAAAFQGDTGAPPIFKSPPLPTPHSRFPHSSPSTPRLNGKAILFARQDLVFPAQGPWRASLLPWHEIAVPEFADIPNPQTPILKGHPILTLFASGLSVDECLMSLKQKVRATEGWLYP